MAKASKAAQMGSGSSKTNFDKIAKAAMSREMLAAGLTAAAAAIAASPKARKAIRDAGLDAADSASQAATTMMTNASKLGSLIAEAVADAAQRVCRANGPMRAAPAYRQRPSRWQERPRRAKPVPPASRRAKAKTASKTKTARPAAKSGAPPSVVRVPGRGSGRPPSRRRRRPG